MAGSLPAAMFPTQAEVQLDRLLALPLTGTEQVDVSEEQQTLASFYSRSRKGKQRATEQDILTEDTASDAVVAAQLASAAERDERETRALALFCELWEERCADGSATPADPVGAAAAQPAHAHTGLLIDLDASDGEDAERPAGNTLVGCVTTSAAARETEAQELPPPALSLPHARASTGSEDQGAARLEERNEDLEGGRESRPPLSSVPLSNREANQQAGSGSTSRLSNDSEQVRAARASSLL